MMCSNEAISRRAALASFLFSLNLCAEKKKEVVMDDNDR
jgi:hypothetical protein